MRDVFFFALLCAVCIAALVMLTWAATSVSAQDALPDEQTVAQYEQQATAFIRALPQQRQQLKTKTYSGALTAVLEAARNDAQNILDQARDAGQKADVVIRAKARTQQGRQKLGQMVEKSLNTTKEQKIASGADLLLAIAEFARGGQDMPPADTPEYVQEALRREQLLDAALEIVSSELTDEAQSE